MRILFLTTYFPPDSAANGILMNQLALELRSAGHQVTVVTTFPHYDGNRPPDRFRWKIWVKEWWGGMPIYRVFVYIPKKKNWILGRMINYAIWNLLSLLAGLWVGRHDVLFVPSPPLSNGVIGYLISMIRRTPFVYNVQDVYPDIAVRLGVLRSERVIRAFRALEAFVYAKAAAVCVISPGFKENLLSKGVPGDKLWIIPNFADIEFIRPLPRVNKFSAAHGLDDRFIVMYAGNVGLSQGLETLLEAAAILREVPEILFLIIGNGASKPSLQDTARRMNLDNVRFHSFFAYQDVPEMYASSDVGLVVLKQGISAESAPSKVFSIFAASRPVIASVDEGSDTWNLVADANCGFCISTEDPQGLADAVLHLHRDRALCARLGESGRRYVEKHHSGRLTAAKYERLFMHIVNKVN